MPDMTRDDMNAMIVALVAILVGFALMVLF